MKSSIYYLLGLSLLVCSCENQVRPSDASEEAAVEVQTQRIVGKTMGTTYSVIYVAKEGLAKGDDWDAFSLGLKTTIDSSLVALNNEVSNWEPASTVVRFNASEAGIGVADAPHFVANYHLAKAVSIESNGAFEPTILPLTDYWGFGSGQERIEAGVDTPEVYRRLALVGMDKLVMEGDSFLRKAAPEVKLDLGGSAKGYGTDLMTQILVLAGVEDFLVEIGGEMFAKGTKGSNPWRVGINLPEEGAAFNEVAETMPLTNMAVATSGNYRNYYKVGADTYSHTLNPTTGFPERNSLLSASVIAPDCATADAYATACMVLGPQEALDLINALPDLEAYFLVRTDDGDMEARFSNGLQMQ